METIEYPQSGDHILSSGNYGMTARALIDVVNKLHQCGTDEYLNLPKIAVIGNQSAGKSSLIESISGITLPRSTGTCTRQATLFAFLLELNPDMHSQMSNGVQA